MLDIVQLVVEQVDNGCGNIIAFVGRGTDERGEQQSKKQDNNQKKKRPVPQTGNGM